MVMIARVNELNGQQSTEPLLVSSVDLRPTMIKKDKWSDVVDVTQIDRILDLYQEQDKCNRPDDSDDRSKNKNNNIDSIS